MSDPLRDAETTCPNCGSYTLVEDLIQGPFDATATCPLCRPSEDEWTRVPHRTDVVSDPLRDPNFPDRPRHPDFWRLSECVLESDGAVEEGGVKIPEILGELADFDSVYYMAQQRAAKFMLLSGDKPLTDVKVYSQLTAMFFDGFLAGAKFEAGLLAVSPDIKIISSSDIDRCPIHSLLPSHYYADGSCKCCPVCRAQKRPVPTTKETN